tara:strand:+ start:18652 stop:20151 length:1500 start_codon:yes stop_codon:yes gene_type:complete
MAPPRENRFRNIAGEVFRGNPSRALQVEREQTRDRFFKGDDRISNQRLDKRRIQDNLEDRFRKENLKEVKTTSGGIVSGLTQKRDPLGQEFADYRREVANKYGPTVGEIAADFGRGTERFLQDAAVKFNQGKLGLMGIVSTIADKFNKDYDKLNDVQKEIFENPDKYPNANKIPIIEEQNNSRQLLIDADKAALGLESTAQDAMGIPAIGSGSGFDEQPSDLFGTGGFSLPVPKIKIEEPGYVESGDFKRDLEKSGILSVDDPSTQEPLSDSTKIPGQNSTIGDLKKALKDQGFNDLQIQSTVNQVTQQILSGEFTGDVEVETGSTTSGSGLPNEPGGRPGGGLIMPTDQSGSMTDMLENAQSSVTEFNNPVNLMDVGQAGTTGETYGNGFAIFPDAQTGIMAAKNDLAIKTERYGGNVDKIIGEFSPRVDNPDSFDNYVNFVKQGVGDTVDPGEENELLRRIIQFENKPDIAQQYLALVAEGGLMDKKMYGGIIASKG